MKTMILPILAAFLLVLSAPLLAQEEPLPESQPQEPAAAPVDEGATDPVGVTDEGQPEVEPGAESDEMYAGDEAAEEDLAEDTATEQEEALPQTASPLALLALLGLTAAGSALGLRSARRRR